MIDYFIGTNHAYTLNVAEKEEIESIFRKGGRYISFSTISCGFVKVYDEDYDEKPEKHIANVYGSIINVLYILAGMPKEGFVEIFDLMQKYENERNIKLTSDSVGLFKNMYNRGARYALRCKGKYSILFLDGNKTNGTRIGGETIYYTLLGIERKYGKELLAEERMLDLEKLTDYMHKRKIRY